MSKTSQNKKVIGKVFVLMLTLVMLLGMFGGEASACVRLPDGTTVLPTSVEVFPHGINRAKIIVRGFLTNGLLPNKSCGLGIGLDKQLVSVGRSIDAIDNIITVDTAEAVYAGTLNPVGGMTFVKNVTTKDYLSGQEPANVWEGFTAIVQTGFVSGDPVDLIFDSTVEPGTTVNQMLAQLDQAGLAGGEVDATGLPTPGGSFTIAEATSSKPVAISLAQSQAHNNTALATVLGLVALTGISGATIALRRKEQA